MNLREKKTHKYLEQLGFQVHTVTKPSRAGLNHDLFGLWDHIAIAMYDSSIEDNKIKCNGVIFVQTKSRKQYGKDIAKYIGFPSDNMYIFVWKKNKSNKYELIIQKLK